MNIKISIQDCQCQPTIFNRNQISEVQMRKKNMLYAPPQRDKSNTNNNIKNTLKSKPPQKKNTGQKNTKQQLNVIDNKYKQEEQKFMSELNKMSKQQRNLQMINSNNTILQRQTEILGQNQKTIHEIAKKQAISPRNSNEHEAKNVLSEATKRIEKEVQEIKKMRDEIKSIGNQFKQSLTNMRTVEFAKKQGKTAEQVKQMNQNLKNMVEVSHNHLDGLQNLQAIKQLQNFNVQSYMQMIQTLKKQILQYQKQAENIEKQLKQKSEKINKIGTMTPNLQQQLVAPYQKYLRQKSDGVNLHLIKQKVNDKLGIFDYGEFEYDLGIIMGQLQDQMNDVKIIIKQHSIKVEQFKIDPKQIKNMDLKLPSVLDQYKFIRGIQDKKNIIDSKKQIMNFDTENIRSQKLNQPKKKMPKSIQQLKSKPIDYSTNIKLTKKPKQTFKTLLENKNFTHQQQIRKQLKKRQKKEDQQFDKYLENRAKEQLKQIQECRRKRQKINKMQKSLQDQQEHDMVYLHYDKSEEIMKKHEKFEKEIYEEEEERKRQQKVLVEKEYQFKHEQKQPRINPKMEEESIKAIGKEVLRDKLKSIFGKRGSSADQNIRPLNRLNSPQISANKINTGQNLQAGMTTLAQGFVNMINNTLNRVNLELNNKIQKKIESRSLQRIQRKQHNHIQVPKLHEFCAPPIFKKPIQPIKRRIKENLPLESKVELKNYEHLRAQSLLQQDSSYNQESNYQINDSGLESKQQDQNKYDNLKIS